MSEASTYHHVPAEVDANAFAAFSMDALDAVNFDKCVAASGDALVVVFFWGVQCFNCEIAKKAMLANIERVKALELRWFHSNIYEHRELGRRFTLHGVPTWFFFYCGKKLGRVTGWHGIGMFENAVSAARAKIAALEQAAVGKDKTSVAKGA